MATTIGSGAMTNSIADFEKANVILVTGSNTTETHPVLSTFIKRAVLKNGAKLIVADPRKIDLVRYSSVWLNPKNGTDIAWINGMIKIILDEGLEKEEFIRERTEGFDALKKSVEKYTPEYVESLTGIPKEKLLEAARLYGKAKKGSIAWTMGITQHTHGTSNVNALVNLALITGNVGREGTGLNPLRGQNNVQGACDMGAQPDVYPGSQKVEDKNSQDKFEKAWKTKLSGKEGYPLTEMMNKAIEGKVKALYIMGENPAVSDPNLNHTLHAFESLDFLVVQDIFLTETAQMADVVFPAVSSLEKYGTFTNTERRVSKINKVIKTKGAALDDWKIIQNIANAMGASWKYESWKDIMLEINSLVPIYKGITPDRIDSYLGLQWPCLDESSNGTLFLHKDKFSRGKGLFSVVEYVPPKEPTSIDYPFTMSTGRTLYHYHTGTMTRKSAYLNKYRNTPYFEMNKDDMLEMGILDGEKVKVLSRRGEIIVQAKLSNKVSSKNIFVPFHFAEAAVNKLTLSDLDPVAKIAEVKVCAVAIKKMISE